mmetsp:Transcript_5994/g.13027  ORF Transcript_5994/g.13027 Transcript_5994/m.13027 type:complete len:270 (-) Transcript_5994:358-1167(-)
MTSRHMTSHRIPSHQIQIGVQVRIDQVFRRDHRPAPVFGKVEFRSGDDHVVLGHVVGPVGHKGTDATDGGPGATGVAVSVVLALVPVGWQPQDDLVGAHQVVAFFGDAGAERHEGSDRNVAHEVVLVVFPVKDFPVQGERVADPEITRHGGSGFVPDHDEAQEILVGSIRLFVNGVVAVAVAGIVVVIQSGLGGKILAFLLVGLVVFFLLVLFFVLLAVLFVALGVETLAFRVRVVVVSVVAVAAVAVLVVGDVAVAVAVVLAAGAEVS